MKKIIIAILFLIPISLFTDEIGILKVYDEEGNYKTYDLSEIEKIFFQEDSYSTYFELYYNKNLELENYTYKYYEIAFVEIEDVKKINFLEFVNYMYRKNNYYEISKIDSVIFYFKNNFHNHVYTTIEYEIENVVGNFRKISSSAISKDYPAETDTTYYTEEIIIKDSIKLNASKYHYSPGNGSICFQSERQSDLFFCKHIGEQYTPGFWSNSTIVEIYLEDNENRIDSLIINEFYSSRSYSSNSNYSESSNILNLTLNDIYYELNNSNEIILFFEADELSNLIIDKYFDSGSYSGGGTFANQRNNLIEILEPKNL